MLRLIVILFHAVRALFQSRSELAVENLALRREVAVLKAKRSRPRLSIMDRAFWVALRRVSEDAKLVSLSRVGGLHHRYEWRDAA